jgi:Icc protein
MSGMRIIQMTDPHLYGRADGRLRGVETDSSLRAALDLAYTEVPDYAALLVTGDLVQDDPSGYLRFRSIFGSVQRPVLCLPGNHDIPEAMQRQLSGAPFEICGSHRIGGWQFVMLDSYDPGHVGGRLVPAELDRLAAALHASNAPTMICMHHHPIVMGSKWLDTIGLANADQFWRIVDAHAHVKAVVWGHVHQVYEGWRGEVRLFATPSTGAQFLPGSDRYAEDTRPPAFRSFELHADGRINSQVHWVQPASAMLAAAR